MVLSVMMILLADSLISKLANWILSVIENFDF